MDILFLLDKMLFPIYFVYNLFVKITFFFMFKRRKKLSKNIETKTNHSDTCYIFGNSPMLSKIDFKKFKGKDTFVVNYFYNDLNNSFESKYFLAVDNSFNQNKMSIEYLESLYKRFSNMKFIIRDYKGLSDNKNIDNNRTFFIYPKQFHYGNYIEVDMTKNMTACINCILQCLQCALYMGYKKIYLIGCEMNYWAIDKEHYYDNSNSNTLLIGEETDRMYKLFRNMTEVMSHHYAIHAYAKKHGVEIYNLTPDSVIDTYKRDNINNIKI